MRNTIAIQRGLVLVPTADDRDNSHLAASLQAELMNLGFMLDEAAFAAARKAPAAWLVAYHQEVIPDLRRRLGADREYRPFYRNFPAQVMEASDLELFVNAVLHYRSNGTWEPPQVLRDRGYAFENVAFKVVRLGTDDDLKRLFTNLVSINGSLTEQDKQTVAWLIDTYGRDLVPADRPALARAPGVDAPHEPNVVPASTST
jgi:hypothetical protein